MKWDKESTAKERKITLSKTWQMPLPRRPSHQNRAEELRLIDEAVASGRVTICPPGGGDPWEIAAKIDPSSTIAKATAVRIAAWLYERGAIHAEFCAAIGRDVPKMGRQSIFRQPRQEDLEAIIFAVQDGRLAALRDEITSRAAQDIEKRREAAAAAAAAKRRARMLESFNISDSGRDKMSIEREKGWKNGQAY